MIAMRQPLLSSFVLLAITAAAFPAHAAEPDPADLLLKAMRPVPDYGRQGNVGAAIRELKAQEVVPFRPTRYEYTDYYRVQKPVAIFGHTLTLVEEEYQSRFVGCCVSEGGGFLVRVAGSLDRLEAWAEKNMCSITEFDSEREFLKSVPIRMELPKGHYADVSCRVRDEK